MQILVILSALTPLQLTLLAGSVLFLFALGPFILGAVLIHERQVGLW